MGDFYPNPSENGRVTLDFNAIANDKWTAKLYDVSGRVLRSELHHVVEGINTLNFNFTRLNKGMYFVKLENGTERIYRKLIIQ